MYENDIYPWIIQSLENFCSSCVSILYFQFFQRHIFIFLTLDITTCFLANYLFATFARSTMMRILLLRYKRQRMVTWMSRWHRKMPIFVPIALYLLHGSSVAEVGFLRSCLLIFPLCYCCKGETLKFIQISDKYCQFVHSFGKNSFFLHFMIYRLVDGVRSGDFCKLFSEHLLTWVTVLDLQFYGPRYRPICM